jgi:uncharacterized protein involved in exopolysaccharide biosynthesis
MKIWRLCLEEIPFLVLGCALATIGVFMLASTNEYQSVVRLKVHREIDASSHPSDRPFSDPWFIQTEFEVIQSDAVLGKVIEKLNLDREWRQKLAKGKQSKPGDIAGLLKRCMELRAVRNTKLIEIRMRSESPAEAAKLANTVAEAYHQFRHQQNRLWRNGPEGASKPTATFDVDIVDTAAVPRLPTRPNRPLATAILAFGSLLVAFGLYLGSHESQAQIH